LKNVSNGWHQVPTDGFPKALRWSIRDEGRKSEMISATFFRLRMPKRHCTAVRFISTGGSKKAIAGM